MSAPLQHLITTQGLPRATLNAIFNRAQEVLGDFDKSGVRAHFPDGILPTTMAKKKFTNLLGRSVFNLFFEPSTRTLTTFAIAATRLSADVHNLNIATSSQTKGETMLDTVANLLAMGADFFVIRHPHNGACQEVADFVGNRAHVINAGDGSHAHPTQALLDLYTLRYYLGKKTAQDARDISHLSVVLVGDIAHSRVARSQLWGLKTLGVRDIRVVGPKNLLPTHADELGEGISLSHDLDSAVVGADALLMLRLQKERMDKALIPSTEDYFRTFGLDERRLAKAKPTAIVLHPGPINRGVEIASAVADGPQSVILSQVSFGIAVRMAVLSLMADHR